MLTQDRLKEILHYDPETGMFARLGPGPKKVGYVDKDGYLQIGIDMKQYPAHRLAFLYMTGSFPLEEVDHKHGTRLDNRWSNLRPATRTQNMQNARQLGKLKKGVARNKKRFMAKIRVNKKRMYLGTFKTEEEAHFAYICAAKKYFGEFARAV